MQELGEVCSFQRGLTYAKGDEVELSDNVVLRANNISMATSALDFAELKYIKDSIAIPQSKLVRRDTLMICTASGSKSHLGKVAYVDDDYGYAFGGFMGLLVPEREVHGRFLYYAMLSDDYKEFISRLSDGVNINNLKWDDLKHFNLPVPPLPEQQRIASKLDAAFAALHEAQGHIECNRANARELFESYLNGVFEGLANDENCVHALGDEVGFQGGSQPPKSEFIYKPQEGYVRFLQIRDFKRDDKATYIPLSRKNRTCEEQDIMLGRYGASVGNVLTGRAGAYNVALIKTIPSGTLDPGYFYFYLLSRFFQVPLLNVAARSAQDGFSKEDISGFLLPLPNLNKQKAIAAKLKELQWQASTLETTYQQKLAELSALKQSLLGAAFTGQL